MLKLVFVIICSEYLVVVVVDDEKGYESFSSMEDFVEVGYKFVDVV